jgi:NADPH-dependent 2,4-dienoyl-CoA reductase/sulfur reductase-like enzyme
MAHIVIIGGGFAGVWGAAGAALARGDADLRITLIAPNEHLVLRPRLYEPEPDLAKVELGRVLEPIGVGHLRAWVSTIDTQRRVVVADGEEIGYDRLVLAAGSTLVRPENLPGAERLFDIDTLDGPGGSPTTYAAGRPTPPWSLAPGSSAWRPRPRWPPGAGYCWSTVRMWLETSSVRGRARRSRRRWTSWASSAASKRR